MVITGLIGVLNQETYAEGTNNAEQSIRLAGQYIKNNPELLSASITALSSKIIDQTKVVASVDELPITVEEIQFRKGLREVAGAKNADDKSVFNALVEEKLILSYAINNNLLPTKSEIDSFIEDGKSLYNQDATYKKITDAFCSAANMSIDEYWNTYEYYNAFRIITFKKAQDNAIETGIEKGDLSPLTANELKYQEEARYDDYWKKIKKELKEKSSVTINKQDADSQFNIDTSKLYL